MRASCRACGRWGLDFLRASRAEVSGATRVALLRLALYSFEQLKRVRADAAIDYSPVLGGPLKLFSDAQTMAEALAESERQRPFGLDFACSTANRSSPWCRRWLRASSS